MKKHILMKVLSAFMALVLTVTALPGLAFIGGDPGMAVPMNDAPVAYWPFV
jgi:hypothetical protein